MLSEGLESFDGTEPKNDLGLHPSYQGEQINGNNQG